MSRDTSGANRSQIASLESELEDDREKLLDNAVDNVIDQLSELYEKQKETRDAEIEMMEATTEAAEQYAQWAEEIMSTWKSQEDMNAWLLDNDPALQDMTIAQQEQYFLNWEDNYSKIITFQAEEMANIEEMTNNSIQYANELSASLTETATSTAERIYETARKAATEA